MNFLLYHSLALYLSLHLPTALAQPDPAPAKPSVIPRDPCTIKSPTSGAFFDLHKLHLEGPVISKDKNARDYSWNTTGYDYGYNFTMNFCGPVLEEVTDVVGVDKALWRNVSAYYTYKSKTYSIGQENSWPVLRGRKLVLNYTNGSPCGEGSSRRDVKSRSILPSKTKVDDDDKHDDDDDGSDDDDNDDDDNDDKSRKDAKPSGRRKNTIISLLCDRDTLSPKLTLNFVGASPDECSYFFEARSIYACGGIEAAKQSLSPSGVFGIIMLIAVLVYLVGGCVYSRMVLQQRGWRQCPNYSLWAGMLSFVKDLFIIATSSCARWLPSRRGYNRVNTTYGAPTNGRGRGRDSDAENRLIDELNEEWDD